MIKRTLYFGNPAYLSSKTEQLIIKQEKEGEEKITTIPIEDIGVMILDHPQITITQVAIAKLVDNNVALITCDASHHPTGLLLNLSGHTLQGARFKAQIEASEPLKKNLWQQTIKAKISNQAALLHSHGKEVRNMRFWASKVQSGDAENHESRAAVQYWKKLFPKELMFTRDRSGEPPNNLLNYGYAILRAATARALVGSGLLPTLGIFHRNQYNAYALADDIMEPYRPFVDKVVLDIIENGEALDNLNTSLKKQLLQVLTLDVIIEGQRSPLMVGIQRSTASLAKCFLGEQRKINYPELQLPDAV